MRLFLASIQFLRRTRQGAPCSAAARGALLLFCGLGAVVSTRAAAQETPAPAHAPAEQEQPAAAQDHYGGFDGSALYDQYCASCHDQALGTTKTPQRAALARLNVSHLVFSMANGSMKTQSAEMNLDQQIAVAIYLAGESPPYRTPDTAWCTGASSDSAGETMDLAPVVSRWGLDERGTAAVPAGVSEITAANVGTLELAWAFGLPGATDARSQPVITADTIFLASTSGHLFALDRETGCTRWHRETPAPPRTALALLELEAQAPTSESRSLLIYGDIADHVTAVEPRSGEVVWRTAIEVSEHTLLTGAPVPSGDRIVVPVSLSEVPHARDPRYACCRSHGAVAALRASDGKLLWLTETTAEATKQGETSVGTEIWGPSGVPVWSTPTIDRARGLAYVGTGQNASPPATDLSDSVLALDLETGKIAWHWQALAGDVYNDGCSGFPPNANCPKDSGPDFDIGAAVIIHRDAEGTERLLVGQKSGDVYALDPEEPGSVLWTRKAGTGSVLGGVHWGMATSGDTVVVPIADPPFPFPGYQPKPAVVALRVSDGEELWRFDVERGCSTNLMAYFTRDQLYPDCSFYFGFSAAPTIANDVAFAATLDGKVWAFDLSQGSVLWTDDTLRAYDTLNEVAAHGGAIDVAPVLSVGGMVYVQSGYSLFGQLPGNVFLAYRLRPDPDSGPGRPED